MTDTERDITAALKTEILSDIVMPVIFVELQFSGGTQRFWTGLGTIGWNGEEWSGTGSFGGISKMEETAQIKAAGVTLSLSGIDSAQLSIAFTQTYQGRPAKVWLGALDVASRALVVDPALVIGGRMDTMVIEEEGSTSKISLSVENELIDLERPREFRYTSEDQKEYFNNDTFFDYVTSLQDAVIYWGREGQRTTPTRPV